MAEYIKREDAFNILQSRLDNISQMSYLNMDWHELDIMRNAIENAIDDIGEVLAADVQPVPQWISVKERLPKENQKCLVYRDINADLKITTGIWHSDMKEFYGLRHGTRLEDTIAWMPLLEPPKDGEQNDT